MDPYTPPVTSSQHGADVAAEGSEWLTYDWTLDDRRVTVLHQEPFRLSWFATRLVTFVFVIDRQPESYDSVQADYDALRRFAGEHKRTWLPFTIQCGYALLPIYLGQEFSPPLMDAVKHRLRKRWCVFHVPSLLDTQDWTVRTLESGPFWGVVYSDYVHRTIHSVADAVRTGALKPY